MRRWWDAHWPSVAVYVGGAVIVELLALWFMYLGWLR